MCVYLSVRVCVFAIMLRIVWLIVGHFIYDGSELVSTLIKLFRIKSLARFVVFYFTFFMRLSKNIPCK